MLSSLNKRLLRDLHAAAGKPRYSSPNARTTSHGAFATPSLSPSPRPASRNIPTPGFLRASTSPRCLSVSITTPRAPRRGSSPLQAFSGAFSAPPRPYGASRFPSPPRAPSRGSSPLHAFSVLSPRLRVPKVPLGFHHHPAPRVAEHSHSRFSPCFLRASAPPRPHGTSRSPSPPRAPRRGTFPFQVFSVLSPRLRASASPRRVSISITTPRAPFQPPFRGKIG
jgi:hypothetical protein